MARCGEFLRGCNGLSREGSLLQRFGANMAVMPDSADGGADAPPSDPSAGGSLSASPGGSSDVAADRGTADTGSTADPDRPALSVGAVARRLGVATSTLRTWDRRYGLGPHSHAEGSHRRYTDEDVERLALMRRLVLQGAGPAEAARIAVGTPRDILRTLAGSPPEDARGPSGLRSGAVGAVRPGREESGSAAPAGAAADGPQGPAEVAEEDIDRFAADFAVIVRDDGGYAVREPGASVDVGSTPARAVGDGTGLASAQARGLARAVLAMDSPAVTDLVIDSVRRQGVVASWESLLAPALRAVGRRWARLGAGVEVEHLLTECVLTALRSRAAEFGGEPLNAAPVLLACAAEEQHSLPLYAIAAALAERQVGSRVLGARVPLEALTAAVRRVAPSAVFVWSQLAETAGMELGAFTAGSRPTRLVVGGLGWDPARLPSGVVHVADFPRAVEVLATLAQ